MWFLICYTLSATLQACCKWNADACTFVFDWKKVNALHAKKTFYLLPDDSYTLLEDGEVLVSTPPGKTKSGKSNQLPFGIKVMQMISAAGENSPFVAVPAVSDMEPNTWHVEEVPGLSLSSHVGAVGYVYFSKTRCGTREMWMDYFERVVVPTIKKSNEAHKPVNADGTPMRNFFSTDGEDIIIANAYKTTIRELLDESLTDYGRVGAGTTGIHNACDRQLTFREVKRRIKKLISECYKFNNRQLSSAIQKAFDRLHAAFPGAKFGSKLREDYEYGLVALCASFDKVMDRAMVMAGFKCCGQDCEPDENGVTIDFHKMMYQCYTDISQGQLELMQASTPELVTIIKREGGLTLQDFVDRGIEPGQTTIDRGLLNHVRHWSEIINHDKVVARYELERLAKDPATI
jgi:hypothetical protein